ncbi:hypothetical protein EXIGLDRAFT_778740 [Exidia glandulosa HHB12029]|uniref:Uncharacterized protein n=1 Tax=Exidia glandulosa HHB12029 TaxID=1314781 RepID=A0A165CE99_EXIGL|nr:hypothetical protein EXIGLDRAFT_778740 [Exidia glandulosa HHB12029]
MDGLATLLEACAGTAPTVDLSDALRSHKRRLRRAALRLLPADAVQQHMLAAENESLDVSRFAFAWANVADYEASLACWRDFSPRRACLDARPIERQAERLAEEETSPDSFVDLDWQLPYQLLTVLAKLLRAFPAFTPSSEKVPWSSVVALLLFPHAWPAALSLRVVVARPQQKLDRTTRKRDEFFAAMASHMEHAQTARFLLHILAPCSACWTGTPWQTRQWTLAAEVHDLVQKQVGMTAFTEGYILASAEQRNKAMAVRRDR